MARLRDLLRIWRRRRRSPIVDVFLDGDSVIVFTHADDSCSRIFLPTQGSGKG